MVKSVKRGRKIQQKKNRNVVIVQSGKNDEWEQDSCSLIADCKNSLFFSLIKEISPKICTLCVRVKINKRSFESFCVWILQEHR